MVFRPYEIINWTGTVVKNLNLQLLDTGAVGVRREKMYKLDDHIACAVAGITCACCCASVVPVSVVKRRGWPPWQQYLQPSCLLQLMQTS